MWGAITRCALIDQLNYNHLYYFWLVTRAGTIAQASQDLNLAPSTVSEQLHQLERSLGQQLFKRAGRRLVLTEVGQVVFRFADEIFALGRELSDFVNGQPVGRAIRLNVGVSDALPATIAQRLLAPVLSADGIVQLVCRKDRTDRLLAELALHQIDLVLADAPIGAESRVRAFDHLLGASELLVFAAPLLAARYRADFPRSLQGAPFLLPTPAQPRRRLVERWFEAHELRPELVAEIDDSALLKAFAEQGAGLFVSARAVADEICRQHHVEVVGALDGLTERFYAISIERKLKHPVVIAIVEAAQGLLEQVES
jgi:LysR family transcriptional activator of nhaA